MAIFGLIFLWRHDDFFGEFYTILERHPQTSGILAIHKAIVPIIKLDFEKVKLDIGFASGDFSELQGLKGANDERIFDDRILLNMDENTIRSFNAFRNAHLLHKSLSEKLDKKRLLPEKER